LVGIYLKYLKANLLIVATDIIEAGSRQTEKVGKVEAGEGETWGNSSLGSFYIFISIYKVKHKPRMQAHTERLKNIQALTSADSNFM
jgi:hypothetical protein